MISAICRKFSFLALLLLPAMVWATSPGQEPERIMIMPVQANTTELERNLPDFTTGLREYFGDNPRFVLIGDDQLESLLGNTTGAPEPTGS